MATRERDSTAGVGVERTAIPDAGTAPALTDLVASLAAFGRSMQEAFDPRRFLGEFSDRLQRLVPHDRLVIDHLDDDGRTFTVFAEHAPRGPVLHEAHYTTTFNPAGRYVAAEWAIRPVFAGTAMRIDDLAVDPRFSAPNAHERKVVDAKLRSALLVPLRDGGRIIGALVATSHTRSAYTDAHGVVAQEVADLIAPFIENIVLLHGERRRRRRLGALGGLARVLGASLNVRDVFERLAEAVRPVLDFDAMGVRLISSSGRDTDVLAHVDVDPPDGTPARLPLEGFSFAERIVAGQSLLIHDARVELRPELPGDRIVLEGGGRSCICVPLWFGEVVGGGLYIGRREPHWYDASDVEIATAVAAQVVVAVQHQRLAEEQRRLALAEGRARRLEQRVESLRSALEEHYGFDRIIGRAPALREALRRGAKVAPTETTVLLTGESGTGKELVARAIHHASRRAEGPFVAINCAALPDTLLESELFGHERGAFTGADRQKPGRFEQAAGGTLFLDEVGDLSHGVQAKLLRVIQEREFQRVGGTVTLRADVRLIAATNRDLAKAVAGAEFREDLYYRLNVFTVHLPPLRQRGEDVLLLADHFVRMLGARMGKGDVGLSRDARDALLAHPWPGNIRELANAIERALIVSDGGLLTAAQLGLGPVPRDTEPSLAPGTSLAQPGARSLPEWERRLVTEALATARGNKSRAARLLGLSRAQLYTRMKRFGLDG